jgi:hypothetical protein
MVIPASNDTLFIRGFSSRHHIDEIRDFFTHEGGRNTVEFFKETATGDGLFIALKFDSRSVAKDILNRFDGYEVLGDRISLSWYKDIRKARSYGDNNYRRGPPNQQWPPDRYNDYRQGGGGGYGRGGGGRDNRAGSYRGGNQRSGSGWYPRGSDYSEGGSRSRRYTRSSSRSRSRSGSGHSHSHSASRSSSRDERASRSHSDDSRERTRKRRRSASDASNRRSGRKGKGRGSSSSQSPDPDAGSQSESDSPPPANSEQTTGTGGKKTKGASGSQKKAAAAAAAAAAASGVTAANQGDRRTPSTGRDSKTKEFESSRTEEGELDEGSDGNDYGAAEDDMSSPPQPVPPPSSGAAASKALRAAVRSAVTTVERTVAVTKRTTPGTAKLSGGAGLDDAIEAANMATVDSSSAPSSAARKSTDTTAKFKKKDRRPVTAAAADDNITDEDDMFAEKAAPPLRKQGRDDEFMYERQKKSAKEMVTADSDDDNGAVGGGYMYDDNAASAPAKRKATVGGKKQQDRNIGPATGPKDSFEPFDEDEDGAVIAEQTGASSYMKRRRTAAQPVQDEQLRSAASRTVPPSTGPAKRSVPGAVGLSYEKMQMVRQKKEEIEKAYRQDCETFATVTKMLISKEPSLEEKIQNSLRENLKDIGHRCIQELRDFIERLKEEDIDDV